MTISRLQAIFSVALTALALGCQAGSEPAAPHGEHAAAAPEPEKGPHGGRLLREADFAVEVTIFERGVPPEFRVYAYDRGQPVDLAAVKLGITLRRFAGRVDTFRFTKRDDYLIGDGVVEEPHSFDVEVVADYDGHAGRWTYPSYEGRTEMSPAAIASAEIAIETVGPATIRTAIAVNGRVTPNEEREAHIVPRFPGVVKEVRTRLGDTVAAGEVLAVIEANESLQPYPLKAPIGGTVIAKDVIAGEFAREGETILTVADLGTVWVDLRLPAKDVGRVRAGQPVAVTNQQNAATAAGRIVYLAPVSSQDTQTRVARVELANTDGAWPPGLYVTAEIVVEETTVPAAVKASALQTFRDWDVVFLNDGNAFQAMPVELGRRDAEWAEAVSGVQAGQRYVTENSFVVKADVGKSGATHDH